MGKILDLFAESAKLAGQAIKETAKEASKKLDETRQKIKEAAAEAEINDIIDDDDMVGDACDPTECRGRACDLSDEEDDTIAANSIVMMANGLAKIRQFMKEQNISRIDCADVHNGATLNV